MMYILRFFSSKCSLFHNSNLFGSCIIQILYTGCAKIKKNNYGVKRLNTLLYGNVQGPTDCGHSNVWPDVRAQTFWRLQSVIIPTR